MSETEAGPDDAAPEGPEGDQERVLVVEDDPDTARLLQRRLEGLGLAVQWASHGQEAILVTQNHLPGLVVMDVMMPGLDGFETTRYLKVRYPGYLPVMILTALDDSESVARARSVGADYYLTKPVRHADLKEAVGLLGALRRAEDAAAAGEESRVLEARLSLAERLCERGLNALAEPHLERLEELDAEAPRVVALAARLGR